MRFLAIVKSDERSEAGILPTEQLLSEMGEYNDQLLESGVMLGGEGLQPSSKGARIRISGTKTRVIDGPFAEAKELVAGYWVIQASSRQAATEWLERAPFQEGEVELRPLFEPEDFPIDRAERSDASNPSKPFQTVNPRKPGTKRFTLLLKADRYTEAGGPANEQLLSEMGALMEEMTRAGVLLSGDGLKPSVEGVRIAYSGRDRRVIDGPFTESKELVAGYCVVQTETRQQAIEWACRMLDIHVRGIAAEQGEIEVRQLFELDDFPVSPQEQPNGWRAQEQAAREGRLA